MQEEVSKPYTIWKPKEDEFLTENYATIDRVENLVPQLNRSKQAIYARASVLSLERPRTARKLVTYKRPRAVEDFDWKIYYLRENTNLNTTEIGERIGLTKRQVMYRLTKHNLYYHPPAGEPPEWYKTGEIDF